NPEDVKAVFEHRADSPLRPEHFSANRLNWEAKSQNLKSIAQELGLGLESFIFIDDNPIECAEVEANCPEVLTLQLPVDPGTIPTFLKHCWAFDHLKVTNEDLNRAQLYRENLQREQVRADSKGLADFLSKLQVEVRIGGMANAELPRVAQLTQRTNQFNLTTRRRTETEVLDLARKHRIFTVHVSDRFGDYGLVGVMMFQANQKAL